LGGGGFAVWKFVLSKPKQTHGLEQPCDAAGKCDGNLVCVGAAEAAKCLKPAGENCDADHAADCASGECKSDSKVCAIALGAPCDPADTPTKCIAQSPCDATTKVCATKPPKQPACTAGQTRCSSDGTGLDTCDGDIWKTAACPKATPSCRDAKCQCVA